MTGAETARHLLRFKAPHVIIYCDPTSDRAAHYDPWRYSIGLGHIFYFGDHAEAIAAGAHEAGHALQHATKYWPFQIRRAFWPLAHNLGMLLPIALLSALICHAATFRTLILWLYVVILGFHLLTLPIEFNASRRALRALVLAATVEARDLPAIRRFLGDAALSYVFAFLTAPWQMLKSLRK